MTESDSPKEGTPLTMTAEREAEIRDIAEHFVTPQLNEVLNELDAERAEVARLRAALGRAEGEREALKQQAVIWKSSLECWGRHHPWCFMRTQAGVEGVYCNCGLAEALKGEARQHEPLDLCPEDVAAIEAFRQRLLANGVDPDRPSLAPVQADTQGEG